MAGTMGKGNQVSAIQEVVINDVESSLCEDPTQPKLRVATVGRDVFLSIVKVEIKAESGSLFHRAETIAEVAVSLDALTGALALLTDSEKS